MSDVQIDRCAFAELEGESRFLPMAGEYADECALAGLPPIDAKFASYPMLDASGFFHVYRAKVDGELVGFVTLLMPVIPHYGVAVAVAESLFVSKPHRKTGAGLKLIRTAEKHAREAGSPALMLSAPTGGVLAELLPNMGYRETNRVFMKDFPNDA